MSLAIARKVMTPNQNVMLPCGLPYGTVIKNRYGESFQLVSWEEWQKHMKSQNYPSELPIPAKTGFALLCIPHMSYGWDEMKNIDNEYYRIIEIPQ